MNVTRRTGVIEQSELSANELESVSGGSPLGFAIGVLAYVDGKLMDKAIDATEGNSFPRQINNMVQQQLGGGGKT
jgi:bacteriocin-like protein